MYYLVQQRRTPFQSSFTLVCWTSVIATCREGVYCLVNNYQIIYVAFKLLCQCITTTTLCKVLFQTQILQHQTFQKMTYSST